ncbi:cysteine dioxygenase family protein [Kribbella sp. NPDC051770]|uniref:cysteine dioxygenase n=1 Tax=Kribbella sp. NPDC051770 TaxID=3155413 RepID=UPI003415B01C
MTAQPVSDAPVVPARQATRLVELNGCLSLDSLPGRDLDPEELAELAGGLAAQPHLWEDKVAYSDEERVFASLHRDANVDVWLICWTPVNDTGWHDHDVSSGAVAVAQGRLVEHNLALGTAPLETEITAGDVFSFGPDHIHRVVGLDKGSVTIHAYSPPLWRMGQYSAKDGVLKRTSVSYADELRPID